jgi:hypothetical protein
MNLRDIPMLESAIKARTHRHDHSHTGHVHRWQHAISRRQFARTAAGAVVAGSALGAGWWRPRLAEAHRAHEPVPIPGGTPVVGGAFHVFGPGLSAPFHK